MLSKSLIQFSADGGDYVPSLLFDMSPKYGGGKEDNSNLLQKAPCRHYYTQCPQPAAGHVRSTSPPDTPGHTRASLGQSLVGLPLQVPSVLVHTSFCLCPLRVCFPSPFLSSGGSMVELMATSSKRAYAISSSTATRAPDPAVVHC